MVVCVTSLETHTTTIHNVSNRRNSTPCRILRSRYGERNVPNEPRRLNLNKKLTQEVWTWDSDEENNGKYPVIFYSKSCDGGYNRHSFVTHFFLPLISFCHSFLFVTHFFLSLSRVVNIYSTASLHTGFRRPEAVMLHSKAPHPLSSCSCEEPYSSCTCRHPCTCNPFCVWNECPCDPWNEFLW